MTKWTRHIYQPGLPLGEDGRRVTGSAEHTLLARKGASEGMVLLKNERQTLPLSKGTRIALLGKGTVDYVKGGGGSGDVTTAYTKSLYDGMKEKEAEEKVSLYHELAAFYEKNIQEQYAAGYEPGMTREPEIPAELLEGAAAYAETAIVSICRFSGEGWDRKATLEECDTLWEAAVQQVKRQIEVFPQGDFELTAGERKLLADAAEKFDRVIVVLNIGGIIETAWIAENTRVDAALLAWQGGMEGGRAAADILCGDTYPSGRLTDTFARTLEDYPSTANFHESTGYAEYTDDIYVGYRYFETLPGAADRVIYPFGYGLSYTAFTIEEQKVQIDEAQNLLSVDVCVTNTGAYPGKEVVQLYYSAPAGSLGKAKRCLGAFGKTRELLPQEQETMTLTMRLSDMASYDDLGKIARSAWVLEAGAYRFFAGRSVRDVTELSEVYHLAEDRVVCQLRERLTPRKLRKRLLSDGSYEKLPTGEYEPDPTIFERMDLRDTEGIAPQERGRDRYYLFAKDKMKLIEAAEGRITPDEFLDQLSVEEMVHLLGGQRNHGISNTFGIGNLPEYGIPEVTTADGPAGLRVLPEVGVTTTAWPCATMLACSFNEELAESIGRAVAMEVKENNIGVWLAPALNIHRSPLCGRNFEYYSEDPLVSGRIGAAVVRGVQSQHIAATIKHFAFNNKETNRKSSDSRVSERAAREIYLKGFEIIVKEAAPLALMTSYNKVNGVQCSENRELLQDILRGEWGFDGLVMTDWWTGGEHYLEAKAGNDLKMANGYPDRVMEAYERGAISREEIREAAKHVLLFLLKME